MGGWCSPVPVVDHPGRAGASSWRSCASNAAGAHDLELKKKLQHMSELSNETIMIMAENGSDGASMEYLIREIMRKDDVEWLEAKTVMEEMGRAYLRCMT